MLRGAFSLLALLLAGCGDEPVAGQKPVEPVGPLLAFTAATVQLGPVAPGESARVEVVLANEGDAPATGLALALRGDGVFSFQGTVPVELEPNASVRLVIVYEPSSAGAHEAALVASGDRGLSEELPVSGASASAADWFAPWPLDFGEGDPSCGLRERVVTLTNPAPFPVVLDEVSVNHDGVGRFALVEGPGSGVELLPGVPHAMRVSFSDGESGTYSGTLTLRLQGLDLPVVLPLEARVVPVGPETIFIPALPTPRVGVLVVIDDGAGMAGVLPRLQENLGLLWAQMADFSGRIAVTTTSLSGTNGCGGADGRFVPVDGSRPRILFPPSYSQGGTPDGLELLAENADVGFCSTEEAQGLEAALRALTEPLSTSADDPRHPEPNDGNIGFLFDSAEYSHIEVVFISNRGDTSPETDTHYGALLEAVGGFRDSFGMHAVTGDPGTGCVGDDGFSATPGDRLAEMAYSFASICDDGWFDRDVFPIYECWPLGCVDLSAPPRDLDGDGEIGDNDMTVFFEGLPIPAVGIDGQALWSYNSEANAVCFTYRADPACRLDVTITYTPACP